MKKVFLLLGLMSIVALQAQDIKDIKVTPKNSWFKAGLNLGVPVAETTDYASFNAGVDVRAQYLFNPHFGIGVASGYNHFFGKDDFDDFGVIPLAGFARYYFQNEGVFVGADFGYGFLTNVDNSGGLYLNPQIGYHNRKWNIYGYYQNTFAEDITIRSIGVGFTYNIMFK
jgi:hypothetical protein